MNLKSETKVKEHNNITHIQMAVAMGLQMLIKAPITAVWAVLKILNIDNKEIVFKNWLGFKRIYIIETLKFEFTGKIIKIILPNKKTKRLVYAFLDNKDRLINYIRN